MTRRTLVILSTVAAACGGDRPAPHQVAGTVPPPLAHHAAPSCPLPAVKPLVDDDAPREGLEGEDRIAKPRGKDRCETADTNLARVETAILASKGGGKPARSTPWDKKRTPERMAQVTRRLALLPAEKENLDVYGFTVLGRHEFGSYAYAY